MTDTETLRKDADRIEQAANLLEAIEEIAPDANVEYQVKRSYASIRIILGAVLEEDDFVGAVQEATDRGQLFPRNEQEDGHDDGRRWQYRLTEAAIEGSTERKQWEAMVDG